MVKENTAHPYSKTGITGIRGSINFISEKLEDEGISLNSNNDFNHFHITTLGTLKPDIPVAGKRIQRKSY
jgi:hypothetical protein